MGFGKAQKIARNKMKARQQKLQARKELVTMINKMDDDSSYCIKGRKGLIFEMSHLGSVWKEFLKSGKI